MCIRAAVGCLLAIEGGGLQHFRIVSLSSSIWHIPKPSGVSRTDSQPGPEGTVEASLPHLKPQPGWVWIPGLLVLQLGFSEVQMRSGNWEGRRHCFKPHLSPPSLSWRKPQTASPLLHTHLFLLSLPWHKGLSPAWWHLAWGANNREGQICQAVNQKVLALLFHSPPGRLFRAWLGKYPLWAG